MTTQPNQGFCVLTIAGSDSGGNAGVQADLRVFHDHSLHACTVFTAMTAQNSFGVAAIHPLPPDFIALQLDAVLDCYSIRALKTGMLHNADAIATVASRLERYPNIIKVIDPVMIATSGANLIDERAVDALTTKLLPLADVITPNIPEAEVLSSTPHRPSCQVDLPYIKALARTLRDKFGASILVKGGHGAGGESCDVLAARGLDSEEVFALPRIENPVSTHGTGCSLASALASRLALGDTLSDAVRNAKLYVHHAIAASYLVGENCGVLGFVRPANFQT